MYLSGVVFNNIKDQLLALSHVTVYRKGNVNANPEDRHWYYILREKNGYERNLVRQHKRIGPFFYYQFLLKQDCELFIDLATRPNLQLIQM
jgi:hypothetical protein